MIEESFIETDEKYHSGIVLDEYNDKMSVCQSNKGQDDKLYLRWCYPQAKDRKPSEKTLPWKIDLGTIDEAINIFKKYITILEEMQKPAKHTPLPGKEPMPDDIPF